MNAVLLAWVKRHEVIAYSILAYVISWVLVAPLVTDGLGLTSWHISTVWHALGALGPLVAAFVVTTLVSGRAGVRLLMASMGRWRVGVGWVLVAVLSPFGMFALAAVMLRLVGQPWPDLSLLANQFGNPTWLFGAFLAAAVYGLGEEPGWRGFALPRLQRCHSALVASLVVGGIWAAWHIPFFAYRYQLGGIDLLFFVLGVLAGSIWLTSLYNSTGGSVLKHRGQCTDGDALACDMEHGQRHGCRSIRRYCRAVDGADDSCCGCHPLGLETGQPLASYQVCTRRHAYGTLCCTAVATRRE